MLTDLSIDCLFYRFNKYDRHCKEQQSSNQNSSATISATLNHTSHRSKHSRTASITQKGPLLHFLPMIMSFICLTIAFADGAPADLDPLEFKRDLEPGVDSPTMEMAKRLESYQDQMTVYKRAVVDTSVNRYVQNPKVRYMVASILGIIKNFASVRPILKPPPFLSVTFWGGCCKADHRVDAVEDSQNWLDANFSTPPPPHSPNSSLLDLLSVRFTERFACWIFLAFWQWNTN